jgi:hypothetical protein
MGKPAESPRAWEPHEQHSRWKDESVSFAPKAVRPLTEDSCARSVDDEAGETGQIERPGQRPEEEAHAHGQQREDCAQCGGEVAVSRWRSEAVRSPRSRRRPRSSAISYSCFQCGRRFEVQHVEQSGELAVEISADLRNFIAAKAGKNRARLVDGESSLSI